MNGQKRNSDRMNAGSGSGAPLLAGLMIGGLVGAGAMLLFAPQAGKRTREELQEGARDLRDRTSDSVRQAVSQARSRADELTSNVRDTASSLQNQGKDIAIEQLDRVSSAAQSRKKAIQASKND